MSNLANSSGSSGISDPKNTISPSLTQKQSSSDPSAERKESGSSSPSVSTANSARAQSVFLHDVNPNSLTDVPKLKSNLTSDYDEWKKEFKYWAGSKGVWTFLNTSADKASDDAFNYLSPFGLTPEQCKAKFLSLSSRLWSVICIAINGAMGSSLADSIESEQQHCNGLANPPFLENNCNYLWTKIMETFEKKSGSATIQCIEDLINLRFENKENPLQFRQRIELIPLI